MKRKEYENSERVQCPQNTQRDVQKGNHLSSCCNPQGEAGEYSGFQKMRRDLRRQTAHRKIPPKNNVKVNGFSSALALCARKRNKKKEILKLEHSGGEAP